MLRWSRATKHKTNRPISFLFCEPLLLTTLFPKSSLINSHILLCSKNKSKQTKISVSPNKNLTNVAFTRYSCWINKPLFALPLTFKILTYYLLVSLWVTSPVKHTHSHTCWSSSSRGNCNSSPPEINTSSLPESFSSVYVEKLRKITLAHTTTQRNVPRDSEKPRRWWTSVTWLASSLPATNHWRPFFHTHKFLISRRYNLAQPPLPPSSTTQWGRFSAQFTATRRCCCLFIHLSESAGCYKYKFWLSCGRRHWPWQVVVVVGVAVAITVRGR